MSCRVGWLDLSFLLAVFMGLFCGHGDGAPVTFRLGLFQENQTDRNIVIEKIGFQTAMNDINVLLGAVNVALDLTSTWVVQDDSASEGSIAAIAFHFRGVQAFFAGSSSQSCMSYSAAIGCYQAPVIAPIGCLDPEFLNRVRFPTFARFGGATASFLLLRDFMLALNLQHVVPIFSSTNSNLVESLSSILAAKQLTSTPPILFIPGCDETTKALIATNAKRTGYRLIFVMGAHSDIRELFIEFHNAGMDKEDYAFVHSGLTIDDVVDPTDTADRNYAATQALHGSFALTSSIEPSSQYTAFLKKLNDTCCKTYRCLTDMDRPSIISAARYYDAVTMYGAALTQALNNSNLNSSSLSLVNYPMQALNILTSTTFRGISANYIFTSDKESILPTTLSNLLFPSAALSPPIVNYVGFLYSNGTWFYPNAMIFAGNVPKAPIDYLLVQESVSWWDLDAHKAAVFAPIAAVLLVLLVVAVFLYRRGRHAKKVAKRVEEARVLYETKADKLRAEESNENKRKFLRYMMHELRVPFHVLAVGLQSITDDFRELPLKFKPLITQMNEASDMMLALMNDALDLQRIEDGRFEAYLVDFDATKMLKYIINAHSIRAANKKLNMTLNQLGLAGSVMVLSDENRIRQCVSNLVDNAIKFSPVGGNIAVDCHIDDTQLTISVKDQGPGISDTDRTKLFEAWSQINAGVLQKGKGSGLGLSLVKTIMTVLGGECKVSSQLGEGSCFILSVPVKTTPILHNSSSISLTDPATSEADDHSECEESSGVDGLHILVVDDVHMVRSVTSRLLTQKGATVDQACDGQEAVEKVVQSLEKMDPYDLVLMDKEMPIMDGYEATAKVSRSVTVFGMTANALLEDILEYKEHGATEVLTKPLKFDQLLSCIARHNIRKKKKIRIFSTPSITIASVVDRATTSTPPSTTIITPTYAKFCNFPLNLNLGTLDLDSNTMFA